MKFQVTKSPWCNSTGAKWTITEIGDQTFVKMKIVEKKGDDVVAYVEIEDPSCSIEELTSTALDYAMRLIRIEEKRGNWRRDFGQI